MRMISSAAVAVALMGCGASVSSRSIGRSRFVIDGGGDGWTSSGEVMELMHREAARRCPAGYDIVDANSSTRVAGANGNVASRPEGAMVIECQAAPGHGPRPAAEPGAATAERARIKAQIEADPAQAMIGLGISVEAFEGVAYALYERWKREHPDPEPKAAAQSWSGDTGTQPKRWCFLSESGQIGVCGATAASCEKMRAESGETGSRPCKQWDPVNCFMRESIRESGKQEMLCTPQSSHCSLLIEYMETRETGWRLVSGCARY